MISLEQYLNTGYPDGDAEFVDGRVIDRNLPAADGVLWTRNPDLSLPLDRLF